MNTVAKIKNYLIGVWEEMKKVIWPSRKEVVNHTTIVIISVIIAAIVFGFIDFLLSIGLENIILRTR